MVDAHRRAAAYWSWRVQVWPQDMAADVHDLLEARHHLLAAGEVEEAGTVTEGICSQLDQWGAWDREAALVLDTLRRLPESSDRRAAWILQLGMLAQARGGYDGAEARYRQSLEMEERLGNLAGMASGYHQLGMLAQDRGDYDGAEAGYLRSLEINERLRNMTGMASSCSQLGILVAEQGSEAAAVEWHVKALSIRLRLGVPQMAIDRRRLSHLRRSLGRERFDQLLTASLDDDSQQNLHGLLDRSEGEPKGPPDQESGS